MGYSRAIRYAATFALGITAPTPILSRDSIVSGLSAGKLVSLCEGHATLQLDGCGGYIFGASDALADDPRICRPYNPDSGNSQIEAVALKYLRGHPEEWNKSASYMIQQSLREAFPCRATK